MTSRRYWVGSGLLLGAGFVVWSAGNWIFFVLAGRLLGPSDYGLVASLLSVCLVVTVLLGALAPSLASANRGKPPNAIFARVVRIAVAATVVGMALAAVLVLVLGAVIDGFPTGPALATVTVVAGIAVFVLALGQMQTERKFGGYSLSYVTLGVTRPLIFLLLWAAGLRIIAPLLGTSASWIIGAAVAIFFVRRALRTPPISRAADDWQRFTHALVPNSAGITAIAILTNVDVIAARLVLPGNESGIFAAASVIAQGLFLVPQIFVTLVLPRLAARHAEKRSSASLASLGVVMTIAVGVAFALVAIPLGQPLMELTYGPAFRTSGDLLPYYGLAMGFMGCVIVLLYHQVARREFRYSWYLLGIAAVQVVAMAAFARSYNAIITVDLLCAIGAIVTHEVMARGAGERILDGLRRHPAAPGRVTR